MLMVRWKLDVGVCNEERPKRVSSKEGEVPSLLRITQKEHQEETN